MEERVEGEIVSPTPEIAWRDDEVGRLARSAGGTLDPSVPPDPTAVPPLIDALIGAGCHQQASELSRWLANVALQYESRFGGRDFAQNWSRMFNNDWGYLTRDLYSCANVLAGRVAESLKPVPEAVKMTIDTYRLQLPGIQCRVGRRVSYNDGTGEKMGVVARVGDEGWCDVVPVGEEDMGGFIGETGPMAAPLGARTYG